MRYLSIIIFMILSVCNYEVSYSQVDNGIVCGVQGIEGPPVAPPYSIPHESPVYGEALRVLIVYVTFPDDNEDEFTYNNWPKPTLTFPPQATQPSEPYIHNTEINPVVPFMSKYPAYTLSDFFCEMSFGKYDVIGDEYKVILPQDAQVYKGMGYSVGQLNNIALEKLDDENPGLDFNDYNNWTKVGNNWVYGNTTDNKVEMIIMCYRNVPGIDGSWFFNQSGVGGIDRLRTDITLDGITINSVNGITINSQLYNRSHTLQIMGHEFTHRFFPDYYHSNIGFMTASNTQTSYTYLPQEIEQVGYLQYTPPNNYTAEYTLSDFIASQGTNVVKLSHFGGTNAYMYIWIANHQKFSEYQGITRGGKNCYSVNYGLQDPQCEEGKGIYIYRVKTGSATDCANYNTPWDIISAEGKYNWEVDRFVDIPPQTPHVFPIGYSDYPIYKYSTGDRVNGKDEYRKSLGTLHSSVIDDPCSDSRNDFFISLNEKGDEFDAFNIGYNEIFSPYSNPSSRSCLYDDFYGITVALKEEDKGVIKIKVYYDDDNLALQELPPSKPTGLIVNKEYVSTNRYRPKLSWYANMEPDFIEGGEYKILRGKTTNCNVEPAYYNLIAVISSGTTEYLDHNTYLYDAGAGSGYCEYDYATYHYKVIAKDYSGKESVASQKKVISGYEDPCAPEERPGNLENDIPSIFALEQNYPNPFNPTTNIQYDIPNEVFVSIKVYDMLGREVAELINEFKNAGSYIVGFNGSNLASGIYYYTIKAGSFEQTRRMVLIK